MEHRVGLVKLPGNILGRTHSRYLSDYAVLLYLLGHTWDTSNMKYSTNVWEYCGYAADCRHVTQYFQQ